MERYLVCCGDSTNIEAWSNIPYFVLNAGIKEGVLTKGVTLNPESLRLQKYLWNIRQFLHTGAIGGFQYSQLFNKQLLKQGNINKNINLSILSHYPALPSYPWSKNWVVAFYIDATTNQIFNDYGIGNRISKSLQKEILRREKISYNNAYAIICMSEWAANSVINDYQINSNKVHVVPGGANLDEEQIKDIELITPPPPNNIHPLRIGFLGKEWERKGGPFLMKIVEELNNRGIPSVLRAIGPEPKDLPPKKYIHPLGFINKQQNTLSFASEIASWHFGSLFSSAEAYGISNRECMRLGTPVLSHKVGGISSTFPFDFCGKLFNSNPNTNEVTNWIISEINPYTRYINKKTELKNHWNEFTWGASIKKLKLILK